MTRGSECECESRSDGLATCPGCNPPLAKCQPGFAPASTLTHTHVPQRTRGPDLKRWWEAIKLEFVFSVTYSAARVDARSQFTASALPGCFQCKQNELCKVCCCLLSSLHNCLCPPLQTTVNKNTRTCTFTHP